MADPVSDIANSRVDLNSDLDFGPVDFALIAAAETALGTSLPTQYRDYLANYGGRSRNS